MKSARFLLKILPEQTVGNAGEIRAVILVYSG